MSAQYIWEHWVTSALQKELAKPVHESGGLIRNMDEFFFEGFSTCVCGRIHMQACMCVHVHMETREQPQVSFTRSHLPVFWDLSLAWNSSSIKKLACLACRSSSTFPSPRWPHPPPPLSNGGSRIELKCSELQGKHSTNWPIFSVPKQSFYKDNVNGPESKRLGQMGQDFKHPPKIRYLKNVTTGKNSQSTMFGLKTGYVVVYALSRTKGLCASAWKRMSERPENICSDNFQSYSPATSTLFMSIEWRVSATQTQKKVPFPIITTTIMVGLTGGRQRMYVVQTERLSLGIRKPWKDTCRRNVVCGAGSNSEGQRCCLKVHRDEKDRGGSWEASDGTDC